MGSSAGKLNAFTKWTCCCGLFFVAFLPGYGRSLLGLSGTCQVLLHMLGCKTWRARRYLKEQIPLPIPFPMPLSGNEEHSPSKARCGPGAPLAGRVSGLRPLRITRGLDLVALLILLQGATGASPLLAPPALSPCCSTSDKTEASGSRGVNK